MALCLRVGTVDEDPNTGGFCHLIGGCLQLYNYTDDGSPADENYLQLHGGTSQFSVTDDFSLAGFQIPSESLEGALERLGKLLSRPPFIKKTVQRQVDLAKHQQAQRSSQWQHKVTVQMAKLLKPKSPYGNTGFFDSSRPIESIVQDLAEFWEENYSAHRMYLVINSQLSLMDVEGTIHRYFSAIPRRPTKTRINMSDVVLDQVNERFIKTFANETAMIVFRWYIDGVPAGFLGNPAEFLESVLALSLEGDDRAFESIRPLCSFLPPDHMILTIMFEVRDDYPLNVQAVQDRLNAVFNIALRTPKFEFGGAASFDERIPYAAELMRFLPYKGCPQVATQGPLQSREERKLMNELISKILTIKPLLLVRSIENPSASELDYVETAGKETFSIIPRSLLPTAAEVRVKKSDIAKFTIAFVAQGVDLGLPTKYQILSDMMDVISEQYGIRCCIEMMNQDHHVGFVFEGPVSKDWISPTTAIAEIFTGSTPPRDEFASLFEQAKRRVVRSSEKTVIRSGMVDTLQKYSQLLANDRMDHFNLFTDPSPSAMKYEELSCFAQNLLKAVDGFISSNGKLPKGIERNLFKCLLGDRPTNVMNNLSSTTQYFEALGLPGTLTPNLPNLGAKYYFIPPDLHSSNASAVSIVAFINMNPKAKLLSTLYSRIMANLVLTRASQAIMLENHAANQVLVAEPSFQNPAIVISADSSDPASVLYDRMVAFLESIPRAISQLSDDTLHSMLLKVIDNEAVNKEFSKRSISDHKAEIYKMAESSFVASSPLLRWVVVEFWSGKSERQRRQHIDDLKCTDQDVFTTIAEYPEAKIEVREKNSCCLIQ